MSSVAIVGMGCRFAGAPDLHAYWELTTAGKDAFSPVPADRWLEEAFFDTNRRATDRTYAPAGAFIGDVRSFPALHLGIPPRRVEVMDPQQRLSIEVSIQAIEDAGYRPSQMPRRTGVFVGVTASEFRTLLSSRVSAAMMATGAFGEPPEDPSVLARAVANVVPSRPFTAPGALANMIAAAVAQELNLHGPAFTVDAACASAMVAIDSAIGQLRAGQIDAALAGGVYLQLSPENYIAFSRIGAISASGRCRPFDARADGFVQGDGGGIIVLKRLDDAVRDGDRIYAVIHGIATNNDGRGDGPMAPVLEGQVEVIRTAWADAGLAPAHLGYVEAHGTGTDVGDETELEGLRRALGQEARSVQLGSAKGNVGHTMSAAGVAGLIRAALALHHGTVPPMAGFESAKAGVQLDGAPFSVPTAPVPWTGAERLAGVSSFGFGGTNSHAVLGAAAPAPGAEREQIELLRLSAPDEAALRRAAGRLADTIEADPRITVAGVARALSARPALAWRASITAGDRAALAAALRALAAGEIPDGATLGEAGPPPKVALLFPGQGAQRVGMLAALRDRFPAVAEALAQAEADLEDLLPIPLGHLLWPERRAVPVSDETAAAELTHTAACQPALVAAGIALWRLLQQVGVQPVVAGGHSLGEFAAAVVGGVLSPRDAVRFAALRGRAMAALSGDPGTMAALVCSPDEARPLLVDGAVIANENHERQTVISGRTEAVAAVVEAATAAGIESKPINVSHAFHSPVFAGIDPEPWLAAIELRDPSGPRVASCIADRPYDSQNDARAVFARHATSPVRFGALLEQCSAEGADLYLQVGAGGPLASFVRKGAGRDARAVLTLASADDRDGGRSALQTLGALWVHGLPLDPSAVTSAASVASLPPIELPREAYWPVQQRAQPALQLVAGRQIQAAEPASAPAPAQAPAQAQRGTDEVFEKVAAVVARVSSYPRSSVRPQLSLVDDLGFDSLMVGDLATGLAEAFPGLGGLPQELLVNRPTVQAIVDHVRTASTGGGAGKVDDDAPLLAYRPVWRPCPLPEVAPLPAGALSGRTALVIGERDAEVTAALKHAGAQVTRRARVPVDIVVAIAPFERTPLPLSAAISGVEVPEVARSLIEELSAQARLGGRPQTVLLRSEADPWSAGAAGVVRSMAREWPDRVAKVITFADIGPAFRAARLVQELVSIDRSVDVRWGHDGRAVSGQEPVRIEPAWKPGPGDRVLVVGGTRGIGAKLAARLAEAGAAVVAVGRSASAELPASVAVVQADATDREALERALAPHLPFTALIHAAGVLADGPIGKVEPEEGERARAVKVQGFLAALAAAGRPPVALVTGSWAGRFGNRHQAYYAAANAQLAELARFAPEGMRIVVAELPPWAGSEMVRSIPAAIQAAMRAEGVDFVGDRAGMDALWADLCGGSGAVVHGRALPWWNRACEIEERLDTETHPYLLDHAIDGVPIFPLAAACDAVAAASGLTPPYEIRGLRLYSGITVKEPVSMRVTVRGDRAEIRVGERATLAYRAEVRPIVNGVEVPPPATGGSAPELSIDRFYREVTFHRKMLQGLVAVDGASSDTVRGRVRTNKPKDWVPKTGRAAWAVDPLALDSAFQMTALVAWERYHRAGTPVALGRMVVLKPFPQGPVRVEARFRPPEGDRSEASFVFRGPDDAPFAIAEGAVADLRREEQEDAYSEEPTAPALAIKPQWVDPSTWPEVRDLELRLEAATAIGIDNPYFHVHEGTARDTTVVGGRTLVNFSSYNYLGLSGDPRVLAAVKEAVDRYGTSVSASRVASGERPFHHELEAGLAASQGVDDALVFTAGHMTNVNVVGHLMKPGDLVLHDELIHDSLLQGIKLSGAGRRAFRHDDPEHLEKLLRELRAHHEKCLILVEGVYSMDGDLCRLPEYVELKQRYGALMLVDEAHSFGVCGPKGNGIGEHYRDRMDPRSVDLWMGTLSKSLASCGGWIAGSSTLIRYLRYTAPGFVYSAGITPANGTAALESLKWMHAEPWRVAKLQENARTFHDALVSRGVDTGPAKGGSGVVPAVTGNSMHALLLSQRLRQQGVNVQPIVYPAVADNAARLRFFLSSTHHPEQLTDTAERVATTLEALRREFPA